MVAVAVSDQYRSKALIVAGLGSKTYLGQRGRSPSNLNCPLICMSLPTVAKRYNHESVQIHSKLHVTLIVLASDLTVLKTAQLALCGDTHCTPIHYHLEHLSGTDAYSRYFTTLQLQVCLHCLLICMLIACQQAFETLLLKSAMALQITAFGVITKSGQTGTVSTGKQFNFNGAPSYNEASSQGESSSSSSASSSSGASASASSSDDSPSSGDSSSSSDDSSSSSSSSGGSASSLSSSGDSLSSSSGSQVSVPMCRHTQHPSPSTRLLTTEQ